MDRKKMLDYCIEEARNGKDFGELRNELKQLGLDDQDIKEIIKFVDTQRINHAINNAKKKHKREYFLLGCFLIAIGLIVTLLTFLGLFEMGNTYLLSFSTILTGVALITSNRSNS